MAGATSHIVLPYSCGAVFDVALVVHITAGDTAVPAGLLAMLTREGWAWHIGAGRVFLGGTIALFGSMLAMVVIRRPATIHLAALGSIALAAALLGWHNPRGAAAVKVRTHGWAWRTSRC
ncbi:hypothetical protein [Oerskovia rustica]|uniref:DUF1275 domain-containing protein n=1 Tax=Oerskovia rustica TaxID=2762237 RepID=A0ABR8RNQ2_9CELL|nr:hypothetical protein [Oerskovia rustica]MBD7949381.1 hypothetical protein [Oerskovia rustica]